MKRHDWASSMHRIIAEHKSCAFEWGVNDCCLFIARVCDSMDGGAMEATFKAAYTDQRSALKVIAEHGSLGDALTYYIGEPSDKRAVRGDVVTVEGGEGETAGICVGSTVYAMGEAGLRELPRSAILKVWGR